MIESVNCEDLPAAVAAYEAEGYRLDMIKPADAPREALVSRDGVQRRLVCERFPDARVGGEHGRAEGCKWNRGRAGMEYRDLIPDRLDGRVIASHIRLVGGGPVDDRVHYHKIDLQMIYCLKGRIRVVYEDQGPPFWLEPGDCVVQPPEIRHRVLESTPGAEVLEVTMPAEHETWIDHEMELPTQSFRPEREWSGQRFVRTKGGDGNASDAMSN